MKYYYYREHCEVEKAFLVFKLLEYGGYVPLERPKISEGKNKCFWESLVDFEGLIDSDLVSRINDIPGVLLLPI
jgi:hypothetical protein